MGGIISGLIWQPGEDDKCGGAEGVGSPVSPWLVGARPCTPDGAGRVWWPVDGDMHGGDAACGGELMCRQVLTG